MNLDDEQMNELCDVINGTLGSLPESDAEGFWFWIKVLKDLGSDYAVEIADDWVKANA